MKITVDIDPDIAFQLSTELILLANQWESEALSYESLVRRRPVNGKRYVKPAAFARKMEAATRELASKVGEVQ